MILVLRIGEGVGGMGGMIGVLMLVLGLEVVWLLVVREGVERVVEREVKIVGCGVDVGMRMMILV